MPAVDHDSLFLTTQWSLVHAAGHQARPALEALCRIYWRPLYFFARRSGQSREDAEDLVQGLLAKLLHGNSLPQVDQAQGRFRAYLLAALKKHMAGEWERSHRLKRGGFQTHLSLDWESAETGLKIEILDPRSPDRLFDQDWARSLLEQALTVLGQEFAQEKRTLEFEAMRDYLVLSRPQVPYAELAETLEISENSARVAIHRLRKRYRRTLRQEIAQTLSQDSDIDGEMEALFHALKKTS